MTSVTIFNLPDETLRALHVGAAAHDPSTETDIQTIFENTINSEEQIKLGTLLTEIGREVDGIDLETERDKTPVEPMNFK